MTKFSFAILLCFCSCIVHSQSGIDAIHYGFEITLNDANDTIYGKTTITVSFLERTDQLQLDLTGLNNGKGMIVSSVKEGTMEMEHYHEKDKLIIKLPRAAKVGEQASFVISYRGIPADGLIISKNKYGHRTFFADNWPNRGHNWLPIHDDVADKATVDFMVTAPEHYQVIANGIQLEETNLAGGKNKFTHWQETVPISTKVMVIGAADFAVNLSGTIDGCIPVTSWVYPEDRDKGFYDYALAAEILPFYIKNVGPYGYRKLANVESRTIFGGLENANTIFYSEQTITGRRASEGTVAHEIAHQWFGNMATEKTFAHLWLSEGFATYMTVLYMENKYGIDTARAMLTKNRAEVIAFAKRSQKTVVDEDQDYMQLLNANSYQKGGWVLHMLRRQLGDTIFWKSIRTYYARFGGKTADSGDLQKVFEEVSGKNLSTFFKQWLYMPGQPNLQMDWRYDGPGKKIILNIAQLQSVPFEFPIEFRLKGGAPGAKDKIISLNVTKARETFSIPATVAPGALVVDPNFSLLYDGTILEKR